MGHTAEPHRIYCTFRKSVSPSIAVVLIAGWVAFAAAQCGEETGNAAKRNARATHARPPLLLLLLLVPCSPVSCSYIIGPVQSKYKVTVPVSIFLPAACGAGLGQEAGMLATPPSTRLTRVTKRL